MKLRRLKILKFRNVQPGTELEFNDGYNVLLGQNGSGKTTLLRLITSVLRGDFQWLENEAFSLEADMEVGTTRITFAIHRERKERVEKQLNALPSNLRAFVPTNDTWSTTMDFRVVTDEGETFEGETFELHRDQNGTRVNVPGLSQPQFDEGDLIQLHKIHVFNTAIMLMAPLKNKKDIRAFPDWIIPILDLEDAYRFDESLEVFSSITGRRSALGKSEYRGITGRISVRRNLGPMVTGVLIPATIEALDALQNPNFDSPPETLIVKHGQASFLADVMPMLGYVGAELKFDLLGKEVTEKQQTIKYGNLRFLFHGRDGSIVNQDHLSYGQKRLLTFFYYLACNPHVVVADELVNGLHHAWIAECVRAMGDRQVFVTSQNPILLDHLRFDSATHVRRTFITCQAKPEGVRDRILWSNMSKKNAESFYRAYKVGIQHVGEILRTKGFW